MPKKGFILNKTRCELDEFIGPIVQKVEKPKSVYTAGRWFNTSVCRWYGLEAFVADGRLWARFAGSS